MSAIRRVEIGPATLLLGDCLALRQPDWREHAVVADPPYGMGWNPRKPLGRPGRKRSSLWRPIVGDDRPFDPAPWLLHRECILWGANHYWQRLPVGATLVWVKKHPGAWGKFLSDAEIAWKRGGNGVWLFHETGGNSRRRVEGLGQKRHPTQKPEALMRWCIERWTRAPVILDPYMGSGTTGVAAVQAGRRFIGIECEPDYFEASVERITAAVEAL
jgi:DNA modification methylase